MRLLFAASAALIALGHGPVHAETLGAWTYTAPDGYKVENAKGRRAYTKVDGAAFCLIGVYEPRPASADLAADLRKEWTEVIEAQFAANDVTGYPPRETKRRLIKHTVGARLRSKDQEFYGQLVVVRGGGLVGSVVIMAANAAGIPACHPAANVVLDSLAAPSAPSPSPAAPSPSAPPGTASPSAPPGTASPSAPPGTASPSAPPGTRSPSAPSRTPASKAPPSRAPRSAGGAAHAKR